MQFLKWALGLVVLLGVVFVLGGFLLPASAHVERSISVARSPAQVFELLNSPRRFNEWSPWAHLDPQLQYHYQGPVTGVGAAMRWSSAKPEVGSGSQQITQSIAGQKVVLDLDFGQSQATSTYSIAAEQGGSRVTWAMDTKVSRNPIERCFGAWLGLLMDRMVGPDFERGLAQIKQVLETETPR